MSNKAEIIQRRTGLTENLLGFCRYLRKHDFTIGPSEISLMLEALAAIGPFNTPVAFRDCLSATLCRSRSQQERFDALYEKYWKELEKAVNSKRIDQAQVKPKKTQKPGFQQIKDWLQGNSNTETTEVATYSTQKGLSERDFSTFTEEELQYLWKTLQQIAKTMAMQANRRWEQTHKQRLLDLKQTVRANLRNGGELMELHFRRPKRNRHKIILICDISKSMDLYSKFLIQFAYTFQNVNKKIESFVFGTELFRVTNLLRNKEYKLALEELAQSVPEWSGGTRIGASLQQFVTQYSRLLNNRTTVLILSDGWDTGDLDILGKSMRYIHSKSGSVIWLNPLAGNPNFKPEAGGMKKAMPYIDIFASGHNLDSLKALAKQLR